MKFINIGRLNELHKEFEKQSKDGDFQSFVEKRGTDDDGIVDIKPCKKLLHQLHDKNLRYLLQCEDEDLRWFGDEYLEKVNFFRSVLGYKEKLTMQKVKDKRRRMRVGVELIELKTDGSYFEFLIHETVRNKILGWEWLPDVDVFKEYLKENDFPEDKLYSEQKLWDDIEHASGFMRLKVERKETAKFICKMIYELFEI